jgi:hypothetical protein
MLLLFLLTGLLASGHASGAPFGPAGHFAGILPPAKPPEELSEFPEEVQLGGIGGMVVNVSGAGGVPAGTVYAVTKGEGEEPKTFRIAMFEPAGAGLEFKLGWEVTTTEGPYERCGPLLGENGEGEAITPCANRVQGISHGVDVDVDQVTGNVYVLIGEDVIAGDTMVTVFKPDGSAVLSRFAEKAKSGEPTNTSEDKVHESPFTGGIAVSGSTVYLFDVNTPDNFYHRLMTFKETTAGNPSTYAYVKGGDIASEFLGEGNFPTRPVTDAAGDIYVAGETFIEKYTPAQPKTPVCKFEFAKGGIKSMTVNPVTGEPFFYTSVDRKVHRLGPCSGGKFSELPNTAMTVAPPRDNLFALAFDTRKLEETREAGILYGAAPSPVPGTGGKGEAGMGSLGYIFAPGAEAEPVVESQAVAAGSVGTTSAELEAQINPRGSLTSYTFQYITEADYLKDGKDFGEGTLQAPSPPVIIGSGLEAVHVSVLLTGLAPDTAYRFRAVATSNCSDSEPAKICKDAGSADPLATYPVEVSGPPDGRRYELVSPANKNGGQVLPAEPLISSCGLLECKPGTGFNHFPMQSAPNGEAVVYEGTPFSPSEGAVIENEYIARRSASGWVNTNLTPPLLQSKGGQGYKAFSDDLSEGILEQIQPALSPQALEGFDNLYRQPTATPLALNPLILTEPPNRSTGNGSDAFRTTYAAHSADFAHQIFEANDALTKETASAPEALPGTAKENNLYEWASGELRLINVSPAKTSEPGAVLGSGTLLKGGNPNDPAAVVDHAISADGKRIFWTSKAGRLFVREDGQTTSEIEDPGKFLVASADGSRVLLNDGCLYLLATKSCTDLTAGKGGFSGPAGRSEDLSRIYFVDTAALNEEENSEGAKAVAGKPNLYAWIDGSPEPQTAFIATLLAGDAGDWQVSPAVRTAEAAPAGRYLAFTSTAQLTGVPNVGPCQLDGKTGEYISAPCPEVFLYDSETATLSCPSCNTSGQVPLGESLLRLVKGAQGYLAQPRYMLDSGRLYFDSRDSLSYRDTNEGVEDVYQYEPQGVGGCTREGGCVSPISGGRGASDSNFLTVDASGDNVFFTTREPLVVADKDQLIDLYDARVNGGFPEPAAAKPCGGETCQPPTQAPAEPSPAPPPSGAGNHKPPKKCKKGQVARNGKCVKKPKHKGGKGKAKKQGGSK